MEKNVKNEQAIIPNFFKMNKIKLGGEENGKLFISPNFEKNNDPIDTMKNTTEKVKFLFPDLSQNDIKNVLERAEYNIEKTIELIRELKQEQKKNSGENNSTIKTNKRVKKRNYLEFIKTINEIEYKNNNNNNLNNNIPNNINNNIKINKEKEEPNQINKAQSNESTNENTDIINIILNNLDEERKNLINQQINYLVNKFYKMKDISELKNLLTEFGFPTSKENIDNNKLNREEIRKKLGEKVKANQEKRNTIVKLYDQYTKTCDEIQKKEKLKEELSNTYVNLLGIETDQKIRKEYYENDFKEYENSINNNYFNGPKEGC